MKHTCSRCGNKIGEQEANYIRHDDFTEQEETEVLYALTHTDRTRSIRDKLTTEHEMNVTQANMAVGRNDQDYLTVAGENGDIKFSHDIPESNFNRVQVNEPKRPEDDPEIIKTVSEVETVSVQKTGLVCEGDCTKNDDEIIW